MSGCNHEPGEVAYIFAPYTPGGRHLDNVIFDECRHCGVLGRRATWEALRRGSAVAPMLSEAQLATLRPDGSTHHDLKCHPGPFDEVVAGRKTFEVRTNDRGFALGDTFTLREWDPKTKAYTGAHVTPGPISYITQGRWGLPANVCVFGWTATDATALAADPVATAVAAERARCAAIVIKWVYYVGSRGELAALMLGGDTPTGTPGGGR